MKKHRSITILMITVVCFLALFILFGCKATENSKDKNLVIGALYPLTGAAASLGQEFKRGAELAVEQSNQNGGNARIIFEDTKTDANAAISGFRKLRAENISFFLTTVSATALALQPLAADEKVLMFADVAHPDITGRSTMIFRHSSTAEQEAEVIVKHLAKNHSGKRAIVFWMNDEYSKAFTDAFAHDFSSEVNLGKQALIESVSYPKTEGDLRTESLRVVSNKPDIVIVAGFGKQLGLAIRRIRETGYKGTIIATMGFTVTPDAVTAAGDAAEGVYHTKISFDENDTQYVKFKTSYELKHHIKPPAYAVLAFNSTSIILNAYKEGKHDPVAMSTFLLQNKKTHLAGGPVTINSKGDILPPVTVSMYRNKVVK